MVKSKDFFLRLDEDGGMISMEPWNGGVPWMNLDPEMFKEK